MVNQQKLARLREGYLTGRIPAHVYIHLHGKLMQESNKQEEKTNKVFDYIYITVVVFAIVIWVVTDPRVLSLF